MIARSPDHIHDTPAKLRGRIRLNHRVNYIRIFSRLLLSVILLAALLGGLALVPGVQTWIVQRALAKHLGLHLSFDHLSARFGRVAVQNLRLEYGGAVLTLPSLDAQLPLISALRDRKIALQQLVAKGWTLDLRPSADPLAAASQDASPDVSAESGTEAAAIPQETPPPEPLKRADLFNHLLRHGKLPVELSADEIDLEGNVLVPIGSGKDRAPVHLTIKGGGLAAGRDGVLAIDASSAFQGSSPSELSAQGTLTIAMDSSRTIQRLAWKSLLARKGERLTENPTLSLDFVARRVSEEETYTLDLARGDRHLATFIGRRRESKSPLRGSWKIDLRESDRELLAAGPVGPEMAATGEGEFDLDPTFERIHLAGQASLAASRWAAFGAAFESLGSATVNTQFDIAQDSGRINVDRVNLSLDPAQPVALAQSLQPFTIDLTTGAVTLSDPLADWLEVSIKALALNEFSSRIAGLHLVNGRLSGEFKVRASDGGFALRSTSPLAVVGISAERDGKPWASELDLTASLQGAKTAEGWQIACSPLAVSRAGQALATIELKASRPVGANHPLSIAGQGKADLEALSAQPGLAKLHELALRSASGNFSTTLGTQSKIESELSLVGQDAEHSLALKFNAEMGKDRSVTFRAPVKIAAGPRILELSAEGTYSAVPGAHPISLRLAGKNVDAEDLRLLAPPLALMMAEPSSIMIAQPAAAREARLQRDALPFWGDLIGRVYIAFDRLKTGETQLEEVRAVIKLDHTSLRLENAQYQLADRHILGAAAGSIIFDPAAEVPYLLAMKLDDGEIDAATLFGAPVPGEDPAFHGRFSIASTLTGKGSHLSDLIDHTEQEFRLKSTGGIVRLLKTHLLGVTQEKESKVGNVADTIGTLFGKLAGMKRDSISSGKVRLNKNTEAVLNFSYQVAEIGYSEITLTARRRIDGIIHLVDLAMTSPDAHITGSGDINSVKGLSPAAAPLSIELKIGVRDQTADLLASTNLLSTEKDPLGYTLFKQPVHFGGSLQHLDVSQWHDLLFEAARQKSDLAKR